MRYLLGLIWMAVFANGAVPLRFSGSHVLVDDVYVNGEGPFCFLLDTGAEATSVSPRLASRLGLQAQYAVEVFTLSGRHKAGAAKANVTLGNASALEVEVLVQDLGAARNLDRRMEGVLGQSFLSRFRHLIDYANTRLTFECAPDSMSGVRIPVERVDGGWAVRTGDRRLVLDSGTGTLTLFDGAAEGFRLRGTVEVATMTGRHKAKLGTVPTLRVGHVELRDVPVVLAGEQRRDAAGLLPLALFRAVYVEPREGWVILDPVPPAAGFCGLHAATSLAFAPVR